LQNQPETALPLLAYAARSQNDVPGYQYAYALALQRCGKLEEAIAAYELACSCGELFPHMLNNLAGAWIQRAEIGHAEIVLELAVTLEPESATFAANLGRVLALQDKTSEAEPWLRHALSLQPGHLEACYQLGTLLLQQGAGTEGLDMLAECLELAEGLPMQRIVSVAYRRWQKVHHL
jgi:tetratricopeptide (TPR) repeat protein